MTNVSMDVDTGGEKANTVVVGRYETQVQGQAILDMLGGLASGNLEIDTSLVDYVSMNLADCALVLNDELREEFLSELEKTVGPLPFLQDPDSCKIDTPQIKPSLKMEMQSSRI